MALRSSGMRGRYRGRSVVVPQRPSRFAQGREPRACALEGTAGQMVAIGASSGTLSANRSFDPCPQCPTDDRRGCALRDTRVRNVCRSFSLRTATDRSGPAPRSVAEALHRPGRALPVLVDLDVQLEVRPFRQLLAHLDADPLEHRALLPDHDPLL